MLPIKDPAETVPISFDFSDEIAVATGPTVSVAVLTGTDPAVANMPVGSPTSTGALVTQMIRQGVANCDYALRCTATGPAGEVLVRAAILPVRALPRR